jgi:hypothetical protein
LNKDAPKGEYTSHDDARYRLGVQALVWDLAGDLVGTDRLLNTGLSRINKKNNINTKK